MRELWFCVKGDTISIATPYKEEAAKWLLAHAKDQPYVRVFGVKTFSELWIGVTGMVEEENE